jgi:GMP synthase-like glutamine amidotransferase
MFAAMSGKEKSIRIAILDLYQGHENQGMRCIREIINQWGEVNELDVLLDEFDVRQKLSIPDFSYDLYISSGGPGSPLESIEEEWDILYMNWLKSMLIYNNNNENEVKKQVFFICHSFQLACRYFKIANVCKRKSTSFGVFPVHMMEEGKEEAVFEGLNDPFYIVDSRDYQVIEPNHQLIRQLGGKILAIEKERPHIPFERALMALRFNEYFIGTQFHPEADAIGMSMYLQRKDKKESVIENHGVAKWESMVEQLLDPDKIMFTYSKILPNFLNQAIGITVPSFI